MDGRGKKGYRGRKGILSYLFDRNEPKAKSKENVKKVVNSRSSDSINSTHSSSIVCINFFCLLQSTNKGRRNYRRGGERGKRWRWSELEDSIYFWFFEIFLKLLLFFPPVEFEGETQR
jgi:hypothetical protein